MIPRKPSLRASQFFIAEYMKVYFEAGALRDKAIEAATEAAWAAYRASLDEFLRDYAERDQASDHVC